MDDEIRIRWDDLRRGNTSEKVAAIREIGVLVDHLVQSCLTALENSSDRPFIAEALAKFGPSLGPRAVDALRNTKDADLRFWLALLLLDYDNALATKELLDQLDSENEDHLCLAARRLAQRSIKAAEPHIVARLLQVPIEKKDVILCLLAAMEDLRTFVPQEVRDRLRDVKIPEIRAILDGRRAE